MFKNLSTLIECSFGRTPTVKTIKEYIVYISKMGFKTLYLGLTDGYKIKEYPYFNYKVGGYTTEDLREIDKCGIENGIEVIASIQTIGHFHFLRRHADFTDLFDTDEVLLIDDERVLKLNEAMFKAISEGLSSRKIHIGFDEANGTGTGRYKEINKVNSDGKLLLLRHLNRVVEMARKFGYTCEIWHDMMLSEGTSILTPDDIKVLIPDDVRVYLWDYENYDETLLKNKISHLREHCSSFGFAGAVRKDDSFTSENELAVATLIPQMKVCAEEGIDEFMITTWTNGGAQCSLFATLPALFVASQYAAGKYQPGGEIDKALFKEICDIDFDEFWSLCYLDDPFLKKLPTKGNRSRWILQTDLLYGNYDMMLSEGTGAKYAELAEMYSKIDGGKFKHNFRVAEAVARVLEIKSEVAKKIRNAYFAKDKEALRAIRDDDILKLIERMKEFVKVFNDFWLSDSMSFGLEYNQFFFGGMVSRYEYAYKRLTDYIENDILIDELEGANLPPNIAPHKNEDNWSEHKLTRYFSCYWVSYLD